MAKKDLSNKKFGKLVAIKNIGIAKKSGSCLWECLCDCGKTVIKQARHLSRSSSCGCSRYGKDLSNKKFGKLLAVKRIGIDKKSGMYLWECLCDCGKTVIKETRCITRSMSCGCSRRDPKPDRRIETEARALNRLYSDYKIRGIKKNKFEITKKDFAVLIKGDCFYCGDPPKERILCYRMRLSKNKEPVTLLCNGIDRLNSALGYSMNNVVSCCTICNRMKLDLGFEEFSNQAKKIYKNLNLKNINPPQSTSNTPAHC